MAFTCEFCGKSFSARYLLNRHLVTHTGIRNYLCPICGKSFLQSSALNRHSASHESRLAYRCDVCGKRFNRSSTKDVHEASHAKKTHVCKCCGKAFHQKSTLKSHELIHLGIRPHECDYCEKKFRQSSHLKIHISRWHQDMLKNIDNEHPKPLIASTGKDMCCDSTSANSSLFSLILQCKSKNDNVTCSKSKKNSRKSKRNDVNVKRKSDKSQSSVSSETDDEINESYLCPMEMDSTVPEEEMVLPPGGTTSNTNSSSSHTTLQNTAKDGHANKFLQSQQDMRKKLDDHHLTVPPQKVNKNSEKAEILQRPSMDQTSGCPVLMANRTLTSVPSNSFSGNSEFKFSQSTKTAGTITRKFSLHGQSPSSLSYSEQLSDRHTEQIRSYSSVSRTAQITLPECDDQSLSDPACCVENILANVLRSSRETGSLIRKTFVQANEKIAKSKAQHNYKTKPLDFCQGPKIKASKARPKRLEKLMYVHLVTPEKPATELLWGYTIPSG